MIIIIWEDRRQDFPKVTREKSVENEWQSEWKSIESIWMRKRSSE